MRLEVDVVTTKANNQSALAELEKNRPFHGFFFFKF